MQPLSERRQKLANHRPMRYRGDEQAVPLASFPPADQSTIRELYAFLAGLTQALSDPAMDNEPAPLLAFVAEHDPAPVVAAARGLGAGVEDGARAAALHDVRGGALSALFFQLGRVQSVPDPDRIRAIAIIARDHMKIMRNVIDGLDVASRLRDLAERPHRAGELADSLRQFAADVGERRVVARVACSEEEAVIADRCVECAAVDRVAYNLLNNAAQHATDPTIDVVLTPVGADLRVEVSNRISEEQRAVVAAALAADRGALFGSFTTTGSGHGLRIVGELVARAYGIARREALLDGGHLGVTVEDHTFTSWFHWPLVEATPDEATS